MSLLALEGATGMITSTRCCWCLSSLLVCVCVVERFLHTSLEMEICLLAAFILLLLRVLVARRDACLLSSIVGSSLDLERAVRAIDVGGRLPP